MEKIIIEGQIKKAEPPKLLKDTKLKYMENKICKISTNKMIGTGFFCKIKYNNELIPVLMTNYHIIDDNDFENDKQIKLYVNDDCKIININKKRKIYSSIQKEYDIMIIKLKEEDDINDYLEIDPNIFKKNWENIYKNEMIYVLHFPISSGAMISSSELGIEKKDEYDIIHRCITDKGSSGGPIINCMTNKVIGIHKAYVQTNNENNYNIGTLLSFPLNQLNEQINNNKERKIIIDEPLKQNLVNKSNIFDNNIIKEINNYNTIKILEKFPLKSDKKFSYLLIGDSTSSKNDFLNILDRYINQNKYNRNHSSISFTPEREIPIQFKNKKYFMQFFDCPGRFQILPKSYLYLADSFIIFHKISNEKIIDNINLWIDNIYSYKENAIIIIIGNKCLNEKDNKEFYRKIKKFEDKHNITYYEISNVTENTIKQILFDYLNEENVEENDKESEEKNENDEEKKIRLIDTENNKIKRKCF